MSIIFSVFMELTVKRSIGIVRAVREVKNCGATKVQGDSERYVVIVCERDRDKLLDICRCIDSKEIAEFITADLRCLVSLQRDISELKNIFVKLGFKKVLPPTGRAIFYKEIEPGTIVVIERTSNPTAILMRVCKCTTPSFPLPPLACTVYGVKIYEGIEKNIRLLEGLAREILSALSQ